MRVAEIALLDVARGYIERGWSPVPIALKEKGPKENNWPNLRITDATAGRYFNRPKNIGVLLGEASHGLTDVDLDCDEAVALAPYILPKTESIFGRASRRSSHWEYLTNLSETASEPWVKYTDPNGDGAFVELRTGCSERGAQTVFPGSMHKTGEMVEWEKNGKLEKVDGADLQRCVALLAVCCLFTRNWPKEAVGRQEAGRVVGGFMACTGLSKGRTAQLVEAISRTADDPDAGSRRGAARDAVKAYQSGEFTEGLKQLRETFGEPVANCACEWLDYSEAETVPKTPVEQRASSISERAAAQITPTGHKVSAYGAATLVGIGEDVSAAKKGDRNNALNGAAFHGGRHIAGGVLERNALEQELLRAATTNGDAVEDKAAAIATIRSGINAGIKKGPLERPGVNILTFPAAPDTEPRTITATPFVWRDPKTIPPRQFLYGTHYIRKFVSSTVAPGGAGKSSLVLTEALSMLTGRPLLGAKPEMRLRVWIWNGEDPKEETERRIAAACVHYGIEPTELDGLFMDSGRDAEIIMATASREGALIARPVVDAIIATIRNNNLDLMIVDPFVASHGVPENDNNAINAVVKEWARIADETNCGIELVHHSRKTNGAEVTPEDGRGASAMVFAARSVRTINPMTKDQGANAGVVNHRLHFRCGNGKANLSPPAATDTWFELKSVPLGNGNGVGHDNGDKVAVVVSWAYPDMLAGITSEHVEAALVKVRAGEGKYREDAQAHDWVGHPIAEVLGLNLGNRQDKARVRQIATTWIENGALRVVRRVENGKERPFVEARDK